MNEQVKLIGQRIQDLREIAEISAEEIAQYLEIPLEKYLHEMIALVDCTSSMIEEIIPLVNHDNYLELARLMDFILLQSSLTGSPKSKAHVTLTAGLDC